MLSPALAMLKVFTLLFLAHSLFLKAQPFPLTIQGAVYGKQTHHPIPFAHVVVKQRPFGVVANEEGRFALHLDSTYRTDTLVFSALGYRNLEAIISSLNRNGPIAIALQDTTYALAEVNVKAISVTQLLDSAMIHRKDNYPTDPYWLEGFYRTSYRENGSYVRLLEAAMTLYDPDFEKRKRIVVDLVKMRKSNDYLTFFHPTERADHLQNLLALDDIRYRSSIFDVRLRPLWKAEIKEVVLLNNQLVYVIRAVPKPGIQENRSTLEIHIRADDYAIMGFNYLLENPTYKMEFPLTHSTTANYTYLKGSIQYADNQGKLYLSRHMHTDNFEVLKKGNGSKLADIEFSHEVFIHRVHTGKSGVSTKVWTHLYQRSGPYDEAFWDTYNRPVDTELSRRIKSDLEKREPLERQFRHQAADDLNPLK